MFYSQFILAKKGPLGTIWIAAHLERKLRKNQVADTDIGVSVDSILSPEVPIALRLSSHLLLGVVRIYSRKVNYLFHDCSEALLKVKQAFRSTAVDLPPEESTAPYHSITLPETFDLDDFELPDNDNFQGNFIDHHVSTREQITLQDSMDGVIYSTSQFGLDERFGDGDTSQLDLDEELFMDNVTAAEGTVGLLDTDSVDHQASPQPMTPFMGMDVDIDDDDDHFTSHEDDDQITTGEDRIMEVVDIDTNSQFDKDAHGHVNEVSQSKFEDVIMQDFTNELRYEPEHHNPKFEGQSTQGDLLNKQNIQIKDTNEAGDCSLVGNPSSEIDLHTPPKTEEKQQGFSPAVVDLNPSSFNNNESSEIDVPHMPPDIQEKQQVPSPAMVDLNPNSFNNNQSSEIEFPLIPLDNQEKQQGYSAVVDLNPDPSNTNPSSEIDFPHLPGDTLENQQWVSPAAVDVNPVPADTNHASVPVVSDTPLDTHEKSQGGSPAAVNMKPISFDINQSSELDVSHMSQKTQEKQQEGFPIGVDMNFIPFDINQSSERENSHMGQETQGNQQGFFPAAVDTNLLPFDINQSSQREVFYMPQDTQEKQQGGLPAAVDMNLTSLDINQSSEREASRMPQDTQGMQQSFFSSSVDINHISFDNNHSSERESSHVPHDTREKQQVGSPAVLDNPISFDVGRKVSSPTSVLTEQMKPTSPAPGILESDSALPGIRGRTETSQLRDTCNANLTSSDIIGRHSEGVPTQEIIMDTPSTSTLVATSNIPSSEIFSATCKPINDSQTMSGVAVQGGWASHEAFGSNAHVKVGSAGNFPELCTTYGSNPSFGSVGAHAIAQGESSACIRPEAVAAQHVFGRNEELCQPRHVIRPCNSYSKQSDTVSRVAGELGLNAPGSSSRGVEPSPWGIIGREEHIHASGLRTMVPGEEYQPNSTRETALTATGVSECIRFNGLEAYQNNANTVISKDTQSGNFNWSAFSGVVPEPERLLSAPATVQFPPNDFLAPPTFRNEMSAERDFNGNGFTTLSGRKRQQMESSPVQQGGSSIEFSGVQSKRTVDLIPNDHDLLSSILGERRSSLPQLRPTPQQSDIASKKRQKRAPRTTVAKRKVLLDDTMVLHGDTIRQQLTSTEDIRRIRKKAPCTRTEIWMIQKYLLEDDIFCEPLFTGMSYDLVDVHNRTYAVTSSRVSEMDEVHKLPEVPDKSLLPINIDLIGEANIEGTCEPVVIGNAGLVNEPILENENSLSEDHFINPIVRDTQEQTRPVTGMFPFDLQNVHLAEATISTVKGSGEGNDVADRMDHADTVVSTTPLVTGPVSENTCNETVGSEIEPLTTDKGKGVESVLQYNGNSDIQSVEKDLFTTVRNSQIKDDTSHAPKINDDGSQVISQNSLISDIQSVERDIFTANINNHRGDAANHGTVNNDGQQMILQHNGIPDIQSVQKNVFITERNNHTANDAVHMTTNNDEGCQTNLQNNKTSYIYSVEKDVFINERNDHRGGDTVHVELNNEGCQRTSQSNGISDIQSAENDDIIADSDSHSRDDANHLKTNYDGGHHTIVQNDGISDVQSVAEKDVIITEKNNHRGDVASDVAENMYESHQTVLQHNGVSDIQTVEKDVFIFERDSQRVDDAFNFAQADNEGLLLAGSALMKDNRSIPEVPGSSSVKMMPQDMPQEHQVDAGCSSSINVVLDNPSVENDKSLISEVSAISDVCTDPTVEANGSTKEMIRSELGHVDMNVNECENVKDDAGISASKFTAIEDPHRDIIRPLDSNANTETVQSDDGGNSVSQEVTLESTVRVDNSGSHVAILGGTVEAEETTLQGDASGLSCELENTLVEDTEFLNFNDDGAIEEEDNSRTTVEESSLLDTSGWSARTRGVARYLKTVFDTESGRGRKVLPIDSLLYGKTRTEASRMFFETLVLKTREYIDVEQEKPFDVIKVKPKGKLVKSDF